MRPHPAAYPPLPKDSPINESFYEIKRKRNWWKYIASGYHLYNIEDQPKSSSSPSFPAISVAWVNRHRRKKGRNTRCCGNSGNKINAPESNSKRIFAKKISIALHWKCCVIFFLFSLFRSLKSSLGWIILRPLTLRRLKLNLESQVQSNLHV